MSETIKDLVDNGRATRGVSVEVDLTSNKVFAEVSHLDDNGDVFITIGPFPPEELEVRPQLKDYEVVVIWKMVGNYVVKAASLADAIELVENGESPFEGLPKNGDYVDDSMEIDKDTTKDFNRGK